MNDTVTEPYNKDERFPRKFHSRYCPSFGQQKKKQHKSRLKHRKLLSAVQNILFNIFVILRVVPILKILNNSNNHKQFEKFSVCLVINKAVIKFYRFQIMKYTNFIIFDIVQTKIQLNCYSHIPSNFVIIMVFSRFSYT